MAIIFDGTTQVCEAFVIVLRFIDDWVIKQRVCRLMLLAKSITGEEVARQLITAVSTELSIASNLVIAAMRDRASVNDVAMRTMSVIYNQMMDVGCFSHTLDHVGEKLKTAILDEFTKGWISLFSHSPKSRLAWRTETGLSAPTYSPTRWRTQTGLSILPIHPPDGGPKLDCLLLPIHPPDGGVNLRLYTNCTTLERFLFLCVEMIYLRLHLASC